MCVIDITAAGDEYDCATVSENGNEQASGLCEQNWD